MGRIGIRALQQHASAVLRRVRQGEIVEVTDRGQRVAFLVPALGGGVIEALESSGRLRPAETDLLRLDEPLRLKRGAESPSERLKAMRVAER